MATNAIITFSDGKLELPECVIEDLRLEDGARLHLVSKIGNQILLEQDQPEKRLTVEEHMEIWNRLRGTLRDGVDTSLQDQEEAALEQGKFER
jgi:hypothetical protein